MQDTADALAASEHAKLFDSHYESSPPDLARLGVERIWRGCLLLGKELLCLLGDSGRECLHIIQENGQGSTVKILTWKMGE